MKRVFIAINLSGEIKQELASLIEELKARFPDESGEFIAKWVVPENLHITLAFIGEVKEGSVEKISQIIEKAVSDQSSFEVKLKKVCYGPAQSFASLNIEAGRPAQSHYRGIEAGRSPRLIWLEIEKNKDLECLADILKKEILKQGIVRVIDTRPFNGHITLARIREWQFKKINPEEIPQINEEINLMFKAESVDLMESKLKRSGSEYSLINSIKL